MLIIAADNVNGAWAEALTYIDSPRMVRQDSRAGPMAAMPWPVATIYRRPDECVLMDPVRDANPIFHCMEALWLLAGRDDATWLDQFVSDFSARFAQVDGHLHGSYGKRWRDHFLRQSNVGELYTFDQLNEVVRLLSKNPLDRQAVIQMWDPSSDLGVEGLKDRPCNQSVMLRADRGVLDITVTCRSNDIVYGCYGANPTQFSFLQSYLAAMIGIPVGIYTQFSNNWHIYDDKRRLCNFDSAKLYVEDYPGTAPLVTHPESFDEELHDFLDNPESSETYRNTFFEQTAKPMWLANAFRREKRYEHALIRAAQIGAPDWREATTRWLQRRIK